MHVIAAKAVAFGEALRPEFKTYQSQIRKNAVALAAALAEEGLRIVSGGTDSHLMLVDLRPYGITGKVAQISLDAAHITTNKNSIPFDPEKPFVTSGVRLGTPAITTRGMTEPEMPVVASLIARVLREPNSPSVALEVTSEVRSLCDRFLLN
jgi:glycine hydroxymethyltransferase